MNWNFFKINWFSIALVILLLAAILRSRGFFAGHPGSPKKEETAVSAGLRNTGTALGLAMEPERHAAPRETDRATAETFLKRFAKVALSEKKKFGVPASVLLAIAFVNSNSGQSQAVEEANNFFAIPCSDDWEGESAAIGARCFRKYETPWSSWRDFSIYLSSQTWFGNLKKNAGKDWNKWADDLEGKDISNVTNFNEKLKEVIVQFRLFELDQKQEANN